ncbi:MAG TPA: hypothetical protein V6C64_10765 [Microcoleaceae cyanobacterium]|jgi:hypothetical protein
MMQEIFLLTTIILELGVIALIIDQWQRRQAEQPSTIAIPVKVRDDI